MDVKITSPSFDGVLTSDDNGLVKYTDVASFRGYTNILNIHPDIFAIFLFLIMSNHIQYFKKNKNINIIKFNQLILNQTISMLKLYR